MIIARAPYRISFLGGGTDLPDWYKDTSGAVISTTIDKYCYISVRWLPPFFEHKHRIVWSQIEAVQELQEIKHTVVRETLKHLEIDRGLEIHHAGDLPARTGMGTSSAFTVALVHALYTLLDKPITKKGLAFEAIHIEQDLCKECVGSQDQFASAFGGLNHIKFTSKYVQVLPISTKLILQDKLMLFFTGFQRNAQAIEREKLKTMDRQKFAALYDLVHHGMQALNGRSDSTEFGRLLHEGWIIKRSMTDNTSTGYIDYLYNKALKAGATGGKLLGAGGGGFLLFYVEPDKQMNVKAALTGHLQVPFKFDWEGSKIVVNNHEDS